MPLLTPRPEDLQKIHAEVNQLSNQRFLVATGAISIFGVVIAWLIPKTPQTPPKVGAFLISGCGLLLTLLFLLYLLCHLLRRTLRVFTCYLAETRASNWELDYARYRERPYWAYTKVYGIVFMVLGLLTCGFPFAIAFCFWYRLEPLGGIAGLAIVWVLYELLVWRMAFKGLWSNDESAAATWKELNLHKAVATDSSGRA